MRGFTPLVILTLLVVGLLPVPAAQAFHHDLPEYENKFTWSAPENYTGDLAIQIGLDLGTDNECLIYTGASGQSQGPGLHRATRYATGGWGTSSSGQTAHVHAEGIDTRDLTSSQGGFWASESWRWGHAPETETITFAGFGLAAWPFEDFGPQIASLVVEVSCRDPFNVTQTAGSTQLIGFTADSMTGGTGASVDPFLVPEANVNLGDGVQRTFTTDRVETFVFSLPVLGVATGSAVFDHPDGSEEHLIPPTAWSLEHTGPTGTYGFSLDRVSVANFDLFWGLLVGLDDVDHLDEILG